MKNNDEFSAARDRLLRFLELAREDGLAVDHDKVEGAIRRAREHSEDALGRSGGSTR